MSVIYKLNWGAHFSPLSMKKPERTMHRGTFSFCFLKWGERISFWDSRGQNINLSSVLARLEWVAFPQRYRSSMGHVQEKTAHSHVCWLPLCLSLLTDLVTDLVAQKVAYLERPNHKLKDQLHFCFEIVREESKHDVVNAKERDQQQSGLGQPPVGKTNMSHEGRGKRVRCWGILQLSPVQPWKYIISPFPTDCS